ncbi:MAG TPA: hypothetical protein PK819_08125, partial [Thermomicrobiales bacterium]|nr:hypothetical protein [Thermomicrobiales bacterium]
MQRSTQSLAWRTLAIAIALLLSLGILPGLIATHAAAAQDDASISQSDFEDLVDDATADDPAYGPEEGDLDIDPDKVTFSKSDIESADFYAEATFQNPYAGTTNQFDYGIQFRSGPDAFLRFIVISDGTWGITQGTEDVLASGTYDALDDARRGENKLAVYADGDTVHVAVNGDYLGSATTDVTDDGSISVGTSFLPDSIVEGETTSFTDFSIWELGGGGGLGPSNKKTPTPTDEEPEGTTYESPSFGFTISYDDTWEVTKDETEDGSDDFRISNGISSIQFLSYEYDGSAEDCIAETLDSLNEDPDFEDVTIATDNDDNELQGTLDDGSAYVVVSLTYQDSDLITYYQCSPIEEGTSIVKITHITAAEDYNDQIDARIAVLDTFSAEGKSASPKKTK